MLARACSFFKPVCNKIKSTSSVDRFIIAAPITATLGGIAAAGEATVEYLQFLDKEQKKNQSISFPVAFASTTAVALFAGTVGASLALPPALAIGILAAYPRATLGTGAALYGIVKARNFYNELSESEPTSRQTFKR